MAVGINVRKESYMGLEDTFSKLTLHSPVYCFGLMILSPDWLAILTVVSDPKSHVAKE